MFTILNLLFLDYVYVVMSALLLVITWNLMLNSVYRAKLVFFYFFIMLILTALVHLSLDNIAMLMVLGELIIVLFFLIASLTMPVNSIQVKLSKLFFFIYILIGLVVGLNFRNITPFWANYFNLYEMFNAIHFNDFYIFYVYFFQERPYLIIFITLILSFFSIFFIMFFYTLKNIKNFILQKTKNVDILRKQHLFKQEAYNPKLKIFKK